MIHIEQAGRRESFDPTRTTLDPDVGEGPMVIPYYLYPRTLMWTNPNRPDGIEVKLVTYIPFRTKNTSKLYYEPCVQMCTLSPVNSNNTEQALREFYMRSSLTFRKIQLMHTPFNERQVLDLVCTSNYDINREVYYQMARRNMLNASEIVTPDNLDLDIHSTLRVPLESRDAENIIEARNRGVREQQTDISVQVSEEDQALDEIARNLMEGLDN